MAARAAPSRCGVSAVLVLFAPARAKRRRRDVLRWAALLGYSPDVSVAGDAEALGAFLQACAERFGNNLTAAHTREIFRWHRECFTGHARARAVAGDPDALEALPFVERAIAARKEGR